jgi:ribosome-binding protein aMBF1 (putative translation factor)
MSTLNDPYNADVNTNLIPTVTAQPEDRMISNANEILNYMMRDDPEMQRMVNRATVEAMIGQAIYEARERAGLTREELAHRVHVAVDEIEDVEEGDYEGDVLTLLGDIANALEARIAVDLV